MIFMKITKILVYKSFKHVEELDLKCFVVYIGYLIFSITACELLLVNETNYVCLYLKRMAKFYIYTFIVIIWQTSMRASLN